MTDQPTNLEEALDAVERDADAAIRSLGAALKAARKTKAAAAAGQIRDLEQSLENAAGLAGQASSAADDLRRGWRFDVGEWFASGQYAKELLAVASEAGVQAFESDDRILSYPVIVQVSATDATVVVDKQKDRRVRPSQVVQHLAALQQRPPKFKAEAFIESLAAAYDYVVANKSAPPRCAGEARRRAPGPHPAPRGRPRLHPPGVRPGHVPARPERRGRAQGRPAA